MSQVVISASYCGNIYNYDANYFTSRNASSGFNSLARCDVGQEYIPPTYNYVIFRGFIYFDTSSIPSNAIITAATVTFTNGLLYDYSDVDFNIIIRGAGSASNPLVLGDYDLTHYSGGNLGELDDTTPTSAGDYCSYTLNSNGRQHINKEGTTKFILLSENDVDNEPPTGLEYIVYKSLIANNEVKLTVTYFEPTESPTVTTIDLACKDRQSTTLTATGNVTSTGGGYTYRGFEYYEEDADLEYDSSMYAVREIGTFASTGEFEMTLYGLKPLTVYWIRAYTGNVFGVSYGDWVLCMTTEVPSYGIYTATNTAKYLLYVSDDEAIAWRGYKGPYSGKQTLINITDITNKTKGVKVLKILPDSKGTFHVCITVKEEIKS